MCYVHTKEKPQTSNLFLGFSRGRFLVTSYASHLHTHILVQLPLSLKLGQAFQKKSLKCNSWSLLPLRLLCYIWYYLKKKTLKLLINLYCGQNF